MNNKITLKKTDSSNKDFQNLILELNKYLAIMDGDVHAFYNQFNHIDDIKYVIIAYHNDKAVGCGSIKQFDATTMEIKRMYTKPESRGLGIATQILGALEQWALELSFEKCILETGIKQTAAIACYKKNEYQKTPNYAQYAGLKESMCFEKILIEKM